MFDTCNIRAKRFVAKASKAICNATKPLSRQCSVVLLFLWTNHDMTASVFLPYFEGRASVFKIEKGPIDLMFQTEIILTLFQKHKCVGCFTNVSSI